MKNRIVISFFSLLLLGAQPIKASDLPSDFPVIHSNIYDETTLGDGKIFLAVASELENIGCYLMVLNNDGSVYKYKKLETDCAFDFKVQPNGYITYARILKPHSYTDGGDVIHIVMDSSLNIIDSVQMQNGFTADAHDFHILPNGHYLLFGYYTTQVDMSQIVEGGYPGAKVSGGIIQELDKDKNVVFQWRNWDHYSFEDYDFGDDATNKVINAFHLNSVNLDRDGSLFVATPSGVIKIDRQTGGILWELGTNNNSFSFIGVDSAVAIGHFGGHAFHRIDNGNVLVYDNGDSLGNTSSQIHEYKLNEENKIATHVWAYTPSETIAGWHWGNAQRLPNGNTVIGWGSANGDSIPAFSEVNENGDMLMELYFDNPKVESYRAFRFPFPNKKPPVTFTHYELYDGNEYVFEGDGDTTGITIAMKDHTGDDYNEFYVDRYPYAPVNSQFPGEAPLVNPIRFVTSHEGIYLPDYDIIFDLDKIEIYDPANTTIYHREFEGSGLFVPLTTTYNSVANTLKANVDAFGEFILCRDDITPVANLPILVYPASGAEVNYELPLELFWTPEGIAVDFDLEIYLSTDLTTPLISLSGVSETIYEIEELEENASYTWKVRSNTSEGTSEWSQATFTTVSPSIEVVKPYGFEMWKRGEENYIVWDDNIDEDVIISLLRNHEEVKVIDTCESNGVYDWVPSLDLDTGATYTIQIQSLFDQTVLDESNNFFALDANIINDITIILKDNSDFIDCYPNPFAKEAILYYSLSAPRNIKLDIYNLQGKYIKNIEQGYKPAGTYQTILRKELLDPGIYFVHLTTGTTFQTMKLILQ